MEPRPDGRGKRRQNGTHLHVSGAAMEPRPDGRGKLEAQALNSAMAKTPQWSPGLMAGGSPPVMLACPFAVAPQWSPGLMAGGSSPRSRA